VSIICVSGVPGGGKTTLAKAVAANLAIDYGSFGEYVRYCASLRHVGSDRASLQQLGQKLVAEGARGFCDSVLNWLNWTPPKELILEGLRHQVVLDALIEHVRPVPVRLLFVNVGSAAQSSRMHQRSTELEPSALMADATERDVQRPLRARADFVVNGDDPLESVVAQVSTWVLGQHMRQDANDERA
jgi:dephospho-CoA kinase